MRWVTVIDVRGLQYAHVIRAFHDDGDKQDGLIGAEPEVQAFAEHAAANESAQARSEVKRKASRIVS